MAKKKRDRSLSRSTKIMAMKDSVAGLSVGEIAVNRNILATPLIAYLKSKWLEKCNTMLSLFVIARDGLCVTCGSTVDLQAGHFIQGRHHSVLFNLFNVHAQCEQCNMYHGGQLIAYTLYMQKRYGQEVIDTLIKEDVIVKVLYVEDLREIYFDIQDKYKELTK